MGGLRQLSRHNQEILQVPRRIRSSWWSLKHSRYATVSSWRHSI